MNQDALHHLADVLAEDIAALSGEDLLAEAAEDFGDARTLAVACEDILASARALATQRSREAAIADPIGNLADALREDIAATSPEALLKEAAEDYGDRHALAVAFDDAVRRNAAPSGAATIASAARSDVVATERRAFVPSAPAVRPSALPKAALATLLDWLMAPMRSRIALGAFATMLLVAILAPGLYERFLERSAERIATTSRNDAPSPSLAQAPPAPRPLAPAIPAPPAFVEPPKPDA